MKKQHCMSLMSTHLHTSLHTYFKSQSVDAQSQLFDLATIVLCCTNLYTDIIADSELTREKRSIEKLDTGSSYVRVGDAHAQSRIFGNGGKSREAFSLRY